MKGAVFLFPCGLFFSRLAAVAQPTVIDFGTEDNTSARPGKVALWTKADSVTHFDMIAITPLE